MLFGLAHQGLRFRLFWVLLAFLCCLTKAVDRDRPGTVQEESPCAAIVGTACRGSAIGLARPWLFGDSGEPVLTQGVDRRRPGRGRPVGLDAPSEGLLSRSARSDPCRRDAREVQGDGSCLTTPRSKRQVSPIADLITVGELVSVFRRSKPCIANSTFDSKPGISGLLAARLAGVPIIVSTVTGLGTLYANDSLARRAVCSVYQSLQKLVCGITDKTIFQNREDARQFISTGVVAEHKDCPHSGLGSDHRRVRRNASRRSRATNSRRSWGSRPVSSW